MSGYVGSFLVPTQHLVFLNLTGYFLGKGVDSSSAIGQYNQ